MAIDEEVTSDDTLADLLEPKWQRDDGWLADLWDVLRSAIEGVEMLLNLEDNHNAVGSQFWETDNGTVLVDELVKLAVLAESGMDPQEETDNGN